MFSSLRQKPRLRPARLAWALALAPVAALLAAAPAEAATVRYLSLEDLLRQSELVVVADVATVGSLVQAAPFTVRTEVGLRVTQALKGEKARPHLVLTQPGGVAFEGTPQERRVNVPGMPHFEVGDRVLLFLERTPDGELVVCGLGQGHFTLRRDPKSGEWLAERDGHDLNVVGAPRPAEARFATAPPSLDRLPLADLIALIEGRPLGVKPVRLRPRTTPQLTLPGGGE